MTVHTVVGIADPFARERGFVAVRPELAQDVLARVLEHDAIKEPRESSANESVLPLNQHDPALPAGAENPYERYTPARVHEFATTVAEVIRRHGHVADLIPPLTLYAEHGPVDGIAFKQ